MDLRKLWQRIVSLATHECYRGGLFECKEFGDMQPERAVMKIIADEQRQGGVAAVIDMDNSFGMKREDGVVWNELLVAQPTSCEEAMAICGWLARSNAVGVVVINSMDSMSWHDRESMLISLRELSRQLRRSNVRCIVISYRNSSLPKGVKIERIAA